MDDYGISAILPNITEEDKIKVLKQLLELGVKDSSHLKYVNAEDLIKNSPLSIIQARILVDEWKKEPKPYSTFGNGTQFGGSRNSYLGPVDQSQNKTEYAAHAQVGGDLTFNFRTSDEVTAEQTIEDCAELKELLLNKAKQSSEIEWLKCLDDQQKELRIVPLQLTQLRQPPLLEDLDTMYDCRLRKEFVRMSYEKPTGDVLIENFFVEASNHANATLSGAAVEVQRNIVAIIGHPGAGKTTLTKNILHQVLEKGLYDEPDFVFYLRFRDINFSGKIDLLTFLTADAIAIKWKRNQNRRNAVLHKLKDTKVLIIFDGLDEAILTKSSFKSNIESLAEPETFIKNILQGHILQNAKKIITSRPRQFYELSSHLIPKFIVSIVGIDTEAQGLLCHYICRDRSKEVFNMIQSQPDLVSYCFIPAIASLVMHCTEHILSNNVKNIPKTISSVFVYVLGLFVGSAQLPELELILLRKYANLAWKLFKANKYYFDQSDLDKEGINANEVNAFLVTTLARGMLGLAKGDPAKRMCFTHLLWQELLVALYFLLVTSEKELENRLSGKNMDFDFMESRMEMVTKFLFGMCNKVCTNILKEKFGLSIPSGHIVVLKKWALKLLPDFVQKQKWNFQLCLLFLCWAHEMNDDAFSCDIAEILPDTVVIDGEIHFIDLNVICNLMHARETLLCHKKPFTINFNLTIDKGILFHGYSFKRFFQIIGSTKSVKKQEYFSDASIIVADDELIIFVPRTLQIAEPVINESVRPNKITAKGMQLRCKEICNLNQRIRTLTLPDVIVDDDVLTVLASCSSAVEELNIGALPQSQCTINGIQALCAEIKNRNQPMRVLATGWHCS